MDQDMHTRWAQACKAVARKSDAEVTQKQKANLAGLPYCNVHSGIKYDNGGPCGKIEAELQAKRPSSAGGKCRQSKDLFVWDDYLGKIEALRSNKMHGRECQKSHHFKKHSGQRLIQGQIKEICL